MRRALFVTTGFICFFFFLVPERILSQQTNGKTLLWRITGKNLTKPSYLFGTIHLTDKKLFYFGDSVYTAIENTQGFAIELNPDEFSGYIVNNMFDAGGYGLKDNNLEVKENYSRIDYDTELTDGNRKELFKAFLAKINQPDSE